MSKQILLIENPASGQSETDLGCLRTQCEDKGWKLVERPLTPDSDLAALLADSADFDAVVGVGGDGTISGIADVLSGGDVPLLAWPGGTANLVAQNLFADLKPETLCKALDDWEICQLDMGELQAGDTSHRFLMLAGAGTDARMIQDSEDLKSDWGVASYVAALLKQFDVEPARIKLTIDGQEMAEETAVGVLIANLGRLNFRLPMGEAINAQDAQLDVLVIRKLSPGLLLTEFWNAVSRHLGGQGKTHDDIGVYHGQTIALETLPSLPIQYDGESTELRTPVQFRVLPEALKVFGHMQALKP